MASLNPPRLTPFLQKMKSHSELSAADEQAILALPHEAVSLSSGSYVFREGARSDQCAIMLSGFTCKHKTLPDGKRQIVAIHMRGDGMDLQNALLVSMDYSVQALTDVELALIPAQAVDSLITQSASVAKAMWVETLIDTSVQREWTVNVGSRIARSRIAHLLCELGIRQEAAGLARRDKYVLPLTQEQIGDATGLTAVHVNRVLQSLAAEGLIVRNRRSVKLPSWDAIAQAGQFAPDYLHPMRVSV